MFFSKLFTKSLLVSAISFAGIAQAAPANLSYDYLDLNVGVGQLGVDVINFREDVRTSNFNGRWSGMITENIYSTLNLNYLSGEGDKSFGPQTFDLDTSQTKYAVIVGGAFPVATSVDIFAGIGFGGIDQNGELKTQVLNLTTTKDYDNEETAFAWEFGVRSEFWDKGLEFEARAEGVGEQASLSVTVPVFINENLALTPSFSFMEENDGDLYKNHSVVSVGLRFNY